MSAFRKSVLIYSILAFSVLGGCVKPGGDEPAGQTDPAENQDIVAVDGKVRFYLSFLDGGTRQALGLDTFTGCKIQVNGRDIVPNKDEKGRWVLDVPESPSKEYTAVRLSTNSKRWYENGTSPFRNVAIPVGQFFRNGSADLSDYPCYARYTPEDGNKLVFNDAFALLDILVKVPSASSTATPVLTSIQARTPGSEALAGRGSYAPSKGAFTMVDSAPRAVLNCAPEGNGIRLTGSGIHFPVIIVPGEHASGIELTLCDADKKMVRQTIPACTLAPGEVKTVEVQYSPSDDLIWYDGFDRLVWGGDLMGGKNGYGYAPDAVNPGIDGAADRLGTELATTRVAYNTPGSGFIQSNVWEEVSGFTVATSHRTSNNYVSSRGLDAYTYLFRTQEYQGMLVVGAGNSGRGIVQTPPITNMTGFATVKLSFRICFHPGATDSFLLEVRNGGALTQVTVDGAPVLTGADKFAYEANASSWVGTHAVLPVPASLESPKTWHEVEATIEHASDGTCFYFAGNSSNAGNHGFYLDDIMVTRLDGSGRKGNLRLLYWNIQNGMWADQPNSYYNFVAWIKKYDPDICVWCESASIYKDRTGTSAATADRFLPNGWPALAARYGHSYTAVGGWRDNYPQTVTSKYPISTILKITDTNISGKPIAHGAAIQEVNVNGKKLWFVTCHMWPQGYGYGVSGDAARETSKANHEGDYYREYEMNYIVAHTVNDSKYASQQDWFLLGDLNSRSRLDNWYYNYAGNSTILLTQDVVLNKTNLKDVIAETHPGQFISSTMGSARIDFVYASPTMMACVADAFILMDKWTSSVKSEWYPSFYDPSDHRPILVDLEIN